MFILNFTHPLTEDQLRKIEELAEGKIEEIKTITVQIRQEELLAGQIVELVDGVGLSSEEWQTGMLVVNPPGYAPAALALVAELHGRMGRFPVLLRLRPRVAGVFTDYEVAELVNLQAMREQSRMRR